MKNWRILRHAIVYTDLRVAAVVAQWVGDDDRATALGEVNRSSTTASAGRLRAKLQERERRRQRETRGLNWILGLAAWSGLAVFVKVSYDSGVRGTISNVLFTVTAILVAWVASQVVNWWQDRKSRTGPR